MATNKYFTYIQVPIVEPGYNPLIINENPRTKFMNLVLANTADRQLVNFYLLDNSNYIPLGFLTAINSTNYIDNFIGDIKIREIEDIIYYYEFNTTKKVEASNNNLYFKVNGTLSEGTTDYVMIIVDDVNPNSTATFNTNPAASAAATFNTNPAASAAFYSDLNFKNPDFGGKRMKSKRRKSKRRNSKKKNSKRRKSNRRK